MFHFGYELQKAPFLHYGWTDAKGNLQADIPITRGKVRVRVKDCLRCQRGFGAKGASSCFSNVCVCCAMRVRTILWGKDQARHSKQLGTGICMTAECSCLDWP